MSVENLAVIDTNALIDYYGNIFNASSKLSKKTKSLLDQAFQDDQNNVRLVIPSVVFIEIFDNYFSDEEQARKIYSNIFVPIKDASNIEVRPIDKEVLENINRIGGSLENHDSHDKIILATAMSLEWPLITKDSKVIHYVKKNKNIIPCTLF